MWQILQHFVLCSHTNTWRNSDGKGAKWYIRSQPTRRKKAGKVRALSHLNMREISPCMYLCNKCSAIEMNAECKMQRGGNFNNRWIGYHSFVLSPLRSILRSHLARAALFYCVNARPTSLTLRIVSFRYSFGAQQQTADTKINEIDYFYHIGLHCCHFLERTLQLLLRLSAARKICTQPSIPLKLLHLVKQCQEWNVLHKHTHEQQQQWKICLVTIARFFDKWECRVRAHFRRLSQNWIKSPRIHFNNNSEQRNSNACPSLICNRLRVCAVCMHGYRESNLQLHRKNNGNDAKRNGQYFLNK